VIVGGGKAKGKRQREKGKNFNEILILNSQFSILNFLHNGVFGTLPSSIEERPTRE
jgi:hypothetical protein